MPLLLSKQNIIRKLSATVYAVALFTVSSSAWSADFTIEDGVFVTSQQTLSSGETGNNSVQGGFVGGSLRLHATDNLRASVDVKYRGAGGRESEFIGRAGLSYNF